MRNFQRLRIKRGLTQRDVADLLGITAGAVWHWENTAARPTEEHLATLMRLFEVTREFLEDRRRTPQNAAVSHLRRVA